MSQQNRFEAFGQTNRSLLDMVIQKLRTHAIVRHIPDKVKVVDLGCGFNGEILVGLGAKVARGIGIDLSVNPKGSGHANIKLLAGHVDRKLELPDQSVNVVLAMAIIEHVNHPEVLVREAYRILKPGGKLVITTPSNYSQPWLEFMAFRLHIISREEIADHKRYYAKQHLREELERGGFDASKVLITTFELGLNLLAVATK